MRSRCDQNAIGMRSNDRLIGGPSHLYRVLIMFTIQLNTKNTLFRDQNLPLIFLCIFKILTEQKKRGMEMAFLKKNSGLGSNFTGRVGNTIYRQCKEGVVIASRPSKYTTSQSEPAVSERQLFRLVTKLVKGINQIKVFRRIWIDSSVKGRSISNKVQSVNKPRIKFNPDLSSILLVPAEDYFKAELENFIIELPYVGVNYNVTIKPLADAGLTTYEIKTISLQGLVCCSEPKDSGTKAFFFAPLLPSVKPLDLNSSLQFSLNIGGPHLIETELYNKKTLLLNLITFNNNLEPWEASENILINLE